MRPTSLRPLVASAAAALAAALLTGCFGSPRPEFYALRTGAEPAIASLPMLGLAIGPLDLPRYLDRPELVTRAADRADDRLLVADAHRWGGSLASDVLRVVADDLSRLLGTARVVVYPAQPRFPADYRVVLDVREFAGELGGPVTLRMRWTLVAAADGSAVAVEESHVEQPTASASYAALVEAESAALRTVTLAIAERIAALESAATR